MLWSVQSIIQVLFISGHKDGHATNVHRDTIVDYDRVGALLIFCFTKTRVYLHEERRMFPTF